MGNLGGISGGISGRISGGTRQPWRSRSGKKTRQICGEAADAPIQAAPSDGMTNIRFRVPRVAWCVRRTSTTGASFLTFSGLFCQSAGKPGCRRPARPSIAPSMAFRAGSRSPGVCSNSPQGLHFRGFFINLSGVGGPCGAVSGRARRAVALTHLLVVFAPRAIRGALIVRCRGAESLTG